MRVYIHGNCQGLLLRGLLTEAKPDWQIVNRQVHVNDDFADHDRYLSDLSTADIVISQPISDGYGPKGNRAFSFIKAHVKSNAVLVTFPSIFFRAHFPEWYYLNNSKGRLDSLGMAYHNIHLANAVLQGETLESVTRRLTSPNLYSAAFLDAHCDACLSSLREQEMALSIDIPISGILAEQCREREIMNAIDHPRRNVASVFANLMLKHLGYRGDVAEVGPEYLPLPRIATTNSVVQHMLPASYRNGSDFALRGRKMHYENYLAETYAYYRRLGKDEIRASLEATSDARAFLAAFQGESRLSWDGARDAAPNNPVQEKTMPSATRVKLSATLADVERQTGVRGFTPDARMLHDGTPDDFRELGNLLLGAGHSAAAAAALQAAREAGSVEEISGYQIGRALLEAGEYEEAITELRTHLAQHPDDAAALLDLGKALTAAGHPKEAVQTLFSENVRAASANGETDFRLSQAYADGGFPLLAQEAWRRHIRLFCHSLSTAGSQNAPIPANGLEIGIFGTSNGIMLGGYSAGIKDHPQCHRARNFSVGGSSTALLSQLALKNDFEGLDYAIFDFFPNEESFSKNNRTTPEAMRQRILDFVATALPSNTVPVIAILPTTEIIRTEPPMYLAMRQLAQDYGFPLFDGRLFALTLGEALGVHPEVIFPDRNHLHREFAFHFGRVMMDCLAAVDRSDFPHGTRGEIIPTFRFRSFSAEEAPDIKRIERRTSVAGDVFVRMNPGETFRFKTEETVDIIGAGINFAQSTGTMRLSSEINAERVPLREAGHFRPERVAEANSLVYMVRSVEPVRGKSFAMSLDDQSSVGEISGLVLQGRPRPVAIRTYGFSMRQFNAEVAAMARSLQYSHAELALDIERRVIQTASPAEATRLAGPGAKHMVPEIWQDLATARQNLASGMQHLDALPALEPVMTFWRAIDGMDGADYIELARCLIEKRCYREGALAYRVALAMMPGEDRLLNMLGKAMKAQNRKVEAMAFTRAFTERQPEYAPGLHDLARICADLGDRAEAIDLYKKTVGLAPTRGPAWLELSQLLKTCGRVDEARLTFAEYAKLEPEKARDIASGTRHG